MQQQQKMYLFFEHAFVLVNRLKFINVALDMTSN